ncbi:MAG: hypothetical protein WBA31_05610, partial [Candidatus Dormiibacterota bacterium]
PDRRGRRCGRKVLGAAAGVATGGLSTSSWGTASTAAGVLAGIDGRVALGVGGRLREVERRLGRLAN